MNKFAAAILTVCVVSLFAGCGRPAEAAKAAPAAVGVDTTPEVYFVGGKDAPDHAARLKPDVTVTFGKEAWSVTITGPAGTEEVSEKYAPAYFYDGVSRAMARQVWGLRGARRAPVVFIDLAANDPGDRVRLEVARAIFNAR